MAYSRVKRVVNGIKALAYVLSVRGHNGAEKRNEMVTAVNMCSSIPYQVQMEKYWRRAKSDHKTQLICIIQSFSKNEFDSNNPNDILKANMLGQEFARKYYPGRQILICTQTDGKGGCVHNHILINDVSMIDNKSCTAEQHYYLSVMEWTDEITQHYTILDCGEEHSDRARHDDCEYFYKDDIRERVKNVMIKSASEDDFIEKLKNNGVLVHKKNGNKYGDYYTYELIDLSKIPEGTKKPKCGFKARSYKLGEDYGPKALKDAIAHYQKCSQPDYNFSEEAASLAGEKYMNTSQSFSEEKVTVPQAVSESEYELEPSMKKSAVPEEHGKGKQAEAAVTAVPTTDKDEDIPAVIQQVINDDEDEPEAAAVTPLPPKYNENIYDDVRQILAAENIDDEASEDNEKAHKREPKKQQNSDVLTADKPKKSINKNRFDPSYMGFHEIRQQDKDNDDEFGF